MVQKINIPEELKTVKRSGKKVDFNGDKIAIAIKKGFDSVKNEDYTADDHKKVYEEVLAKISEDYAERKTIKIEDIQDIVEEKLEQLGYSDVKESYSEYRVRRNDSRQVFNSKIHKLTKAAESLGLKEASEEDAKRENANVDGDTAMGTMLQYGSTFSKEFAKAYLIKNKFSEAHDDGVIHIHDMDFLPMGTTTCTQIDINRLFKNGFSTGHGHLREPNDIMSYTALAAIAIQSNQNDQHGGQSIPAFDYYMAPGVLKTFKKQFKQAIYDFLDLQGFLGFVKIDNIVKEINKLNSIDIGTMVFSKYIDPKEGVDESQAEVLGRTFKKAYDKALKATDRITYQAMEAFIHNLNTMHSRAGAQVPFSSINFGTDTSIEGRMVTKNYLLAADSGLGRGETPIFPISIFKLKEGINYFEEDPNYDLFELACKVSSKRLFPNFSFIDSPFNLQYYKEGDPNTEIAYMGCRTRVIANVHDTDREHVTSRGNLSFTTINLPRLGIKYGIINNKKADLDGFFAELSEIMDMVRDQLLERFEIQANKKVKNFPFLMGQGVWIDSKELRPEDKLRRVLKHGSLSIGFIGLAECLKALTGKHHGESKTSQELGLKITTFMRERIDKYAEEYKLNFTFLATPAEGLSGRFVGIDKSIYGIIPGITDKNYYTNSFHVPVYYDISISNKLKIEGPYHALTNAGHISYVEVDGDTANNIEAFKKIVRMMHDNKIGYGAINHPVDRDPVCGYTGVIGDVCPGCGRRECEGVSVETIKNANLTNYGR